MFIDAHSHGMHAERRPDGLLIPPLMPIWRDPNADVQAMICENKNNGIEKVILLDPPDVAFRMQEIFGDFVVPVPLIHMDESSAADVHALFGRGARGIKFIAPAHSYGDDCYFPLYDAVRSHGGLAVFHTGYLVSGLFDPGCVLGRPSYIDITDMRPAALDRIARALPDLKILMAHFGNPWWEEAWTVLGANKNIYADLSGGTGFQKSMSMWRDLFMPNGRLHAGTVEKLCFASDGTHFIPGERGWSVLMDFHLKLYDELSLPDDLRELISHGNIESLLRR